MRIQFVITPFKTQTGSNLKLEDEQLRSYISERITSSQAMFASDPTAEYLQQLRLVDGLASIDGIPAAQKLWGSGPYFLITSGRLTRPPSGPDIARSISYTGQAVNSTGSVPVVFSFESRLGTEHYESYANQHLAIALYSLAIDARRARMPKPYQLKLAGAALDTLLNVREKGHASPEIDSLGCKINVFVSEIVLVSVVDHACNEN